MSWIEYAATCLAPLLIHAASLRLVPQWRKMTSTLSALALVGVPVFVKAPDVSAHLLVANCSLIFAMRMLDMGFLLSDVVISGWTCVEMARYLVLRDFGDVERLADASSKKTDIGADVSPQQSDALKPFTWRRWRWHLMRAILEATALNVLIRYPFGLPPTSHPLIAPWNLSGMLQAFTYMLAIYYVLNLQYTVVAQLVLAPLFQRSVPSLMQAPLRAPSIRSFWARWNTLVRNTLYRVIFQFGLVTGMGWPRAWLDMGERRFRIHVAKAPASMRFLMTAVTFLASGLFHDFVLWTMDGTFYQQVAPQTCFFLASGALVMAEFGASALGLDKVFHVSRPLKPVLVLILHTILSPMFIGGFIHYDMLHTMARPFLIDSYIK
jgi:hypothetical protein